MSPTTAPRPAKPPTRKLSAAMSAVIDAMRDGATLTLNSDLDRWLLTSPMDDMPVLERTVKALLIRGLIGSVDGIDSDEFVLTPAGLAAATPTSATNDNPETDTISATWSTDILIAGCTVVPLRDITWGMIKDVARQLDPRTNSATQFPDAAIFPEGKTCFVIKVIETFPNIVRIAPTLDPLREGGAGALPVLHDWLLALGCPDDDMPIRVVTDTAQDDGDVPAPADESDAQVSSLAAETESIEAGAPDISTSYPANMLEVERFYYNNAGTFRIEQEGVIVETCHYDSVGPSVGPYSRNKRWDRLNDDRRTYFEVTGTHPKYGWVYERRRAKRYGGQPR